MKKTTKWLNIIAISVICASLVGCGGTDVVNNATGSSSSNGTNVTTLNIDNATGNFTITTTANNVGVSADLHVRQRLQDTNLNVSKLDNGMNYSGTLTNVCSRGATTGTSVAYSCVTTYNTSSPAGDPSPSTRNITLFVGSTYQVQQIEMPVLGNGADRVTNVGSITVN